MRASDTGEMLLFIYDPISKLRVNGITILIGVKDSSGGKIILFTLFTSSVVARGISYIVLTDQAVKTLATHFVQYSRIERRLADIPGA